MIRPRIIIAAAGQWRLSEASVRAWRHTHTHLVARLLLFNEKLWGTSVLPLARCLFGGKTVRDWVSWFCEECARQSGIIIAIRRREEAEEAGGGSLVLEAIAARQDDMSTIGRWVVVAARPPRALSPECGGSFFLHSRAHFRRLYISRPPPIQSSPTFLFPESGKAVEVLSIDDRYCVSRSSSAAFDPGKGINYIVDRPGLARLGWGYVNNDGRLYLNISGHY